MTGVQSTMAKFEPEVDQTLFRKAMSQFASGVTLVTTLDCNGKLTGLTANAFTSVSLDPPMVLVCVDYKARTYRTLVSNGHFAIHFLRADQADLAKNFARRGLDRSKLCEWNTKSGRYAILSDYLVALECSLERHYEGGDHAILVSRVERIHMDDEQYDPLVFYNGEFGGVR